MSSEENTKTARPHKVPFFIRLTAWVAAILVSLVLLAVIALHIPAIQEKIIRTGVARIETATNFKVQIGSYQWRPFSSIYLTDVKIQSQGKPILDCGKVRISYSLSIKRPYLIVEEVYLEKPFLELERSADGKWMVPTPIGGKRQSGVVRTRGEASRPLWTHIQLPRIQIVSGTIEARQRGNIVLSIKDISGAVYLKAISGAEGPKIEMNFENLHAQAHTGEYGTWGIDGSGVFDGEQLKVRSMLLSGPNDCRVQVKGQWDVKNPDNGRADLVVTRFPPDTIPLLQPYLAGLSNVSGSIAITRREGRWTLKHDVSTDLGSVKGVLRIEKTPAGRYAVDLDSHFADLEVPLPHGLPDSRLNGRMEVKALVEREDLLDAKFTVHLDPSAVAGEKVQLCDLSGTFADSVLNIDSSAVKCPFADFKFKLTADLRGLSDAGHKGGVKAEITLEKGNLAEIDSRLRKKLAGRISVEANYDPGNFTNLRLWQAKIDASLNIPQTLLLKGSATYDDQLIKAEYDLNLTDARKIGLLFPKWQGKGRVVSRGTLSGKWPDLLWNGQIDSPRFEYANCRADKLTVKGKGSLAGKEERREIFVRAQNVVLNGKRLASVSIDLDQRKNSCTFRLKGDGILNQASVRLSGKLDRIWDFPLLSVSTQGRVDWKELKGTVAAKFDVEKNGISIHSASFRQGREKISASGGTISRSRIKLLLSMESISVAKISDMLGRKDRVSGTVSGQIQVGGRPDLPECRLSIKGSRFAIDKQQIEALTLQGDYSKGILAVKGTVKAAEVRNPVAVSARIPIRISFEPPRFEVGLSEQFHSDIKISGLKAGKFLPFLHFLSKVGGQVEGDIQCAGTLRKPVVTGGGTWENGSFEAKKWPHPAENIQAQWRVDSKNLYITSAKISHLGGTITVTGRIGYPHFKIRDFQADAKDLQVKDIYGMEAKVSGHAEIKDSPKAALLTGKLFLSKAHMDLSRLETNIAQHIQIVEPNDSGRLVELKGTKSPSHFYNRLTMDVMLQLPRSGTWVTGKGLKLEIRGSLKLKKNSTGPVVLAGELRAIRGVYSFQGRELKIVEGSLVFPGVPHTEPQLRILCRKDIKDVTVQALISGPMKHPKMILSSVPAMNRVDILSYFLFDRPAGDLSQSQSSQLQNGAAAWLGSESSSIIKSIMGNNIFAPDTVRYRSFFGNYDHRFSFDQSPAASGKETGIVEIGKDVTPDLHVVYGREVSGEEGNEVQVEYRVGKGVSLKTQVGGEQSGVDIFWRHDFGK